MDFALRWTNTFDLLDIGISQFYGTNRQPLFQPFEGSEKFIPYYEIIHQTGLDVQLTFENTILKSEIIRRQSDINKITA